MKLYWWFYLAEGTPHIKAYDEESVASLSTTHDETQDSFQMNNGTPNSTYLLQGGYMLAASYWPKASLSYLKMKHIGEGGLSHHSSVEYDKTVSQKLWEDNWRGGGDFHLSIIVLFRAVFE